MADKGSCLHLVFLALRERVDLPGLQILDKFSVSRRKKLEKKSKSDNFDDEDSDFDIHNETESDANVTPEITSQPVQQYSSVINILPRTVGRPKKVSKALQAETEIVQESIIKKVRSCSRLNKKK